MGFLNTVINLARSAWNFLTGIPGDVGNALSSLWKFIGSLHALLSNIAAVVIPLTG